VLNKPGAFGLLAIDEMAKSAPDGYTLMIGNVTTTPSRLFFIQGSSAINYAKDVVAASGGLTVERASL
jgi:tripartite-type tricarboxylate transporter receptor subunit TctC